MKQKLMAVAVAGALAVPGLAAAQVTLSGKLGAQFASMKFSGATANNRAGLNTSSTYVNDNASVIRFRMTEDLGGGLSAIGQYEFRPNLDTSGYSSSAQSMPLGTRSGVSWVGLRSNVFGSVRLGNDNTWGKNGDGLSPGTSGQTSTSPILNYMPSGTGSAALGTHSTIGGAAGHTMASFGSSRQQNNVIWDSPDWKNGFSIGVAYSTSQAADDRDLTTGQRKGRSWVIYPKMDFGAVEAGWTYMDNKVDGSCTPQSIIPAVGTTTALGEDVCTASTTVAVDVKANKLYVEFSLMGVTINPIIVKGTTKRAVTGLEVAKWTSWVLPFNYQTGPWVFFYQYGKVGDNKLTTADTSAKMHAASVGYKFSKRTNLGLSWAKMTNATAGNSALSSTGGGDAGNQGSGYGQANADVFQGEDQNFWAVSLNHSF